ncbi:MAG: DUF4340 domain-containing protein [Bdellovibrionota bacterium]
MKKFRTTIIFSVIVLALGLYAYFGEYRQEEKELAAKEQQSKLIDMPKDSVQHITLIHGNEEIVLEKADGVWKMLVPAQDQADSSAVENFLDNIISERSIEVAKEGDNIDWDDYGLERPIGKIILTDGARKNITFQISAKKNFEGNGLIKRDNENRVLVVSTNFTDKITRKPNSFRERRLFRGKVSDITGIEIKNKLGVIKLSLKDGKWTDNSGSLYELEQNRIREFLTTLNETNAEEFLQSRSPSPTERQKYFLNKPVAEVRLRTNAGPWLGEFGENSARETYALTSNPLYVVRIQNGGLDKFRGLSIMDFRERRSAFDFASGSVAMIKWSNETKTTEFKKNNESWELLVPDPAMKVNSQKVQDVIDRLRKTEVTAYLSDQDQKKFKPVRVIELLDAAPQPIFKIEFSTLTKVKVNGVDKNLILARSSKYPEVFGLEEKWIDNFELNLVFDTPAEADTDKTQPEETK